METTHISHDIQLLFLQAKSFPGGIMAAFDDLRAQIPGSEIRTCYGISRPEKGTITYWAGVEELYPGEAQILHCETMILKKGHYVSAVIQDFMKDPREIGCVFRKLLTEPGLDPNGYCVEWYFNETDVKCMIRKQD
jgi:hypothetical protein